MIKQVPNHLIFSLYRKEKESLFLEQKPISINAIKKLRFTGSHEGMRYMLEKQEDLLLAHTYPQPYCYDATDPQLITTAQFDFSEEGYDQAVQWLNEQDDLFQARRS